MAKRRVGTEPCYILKLDRWIQLHILGFVVFDKPFGMHLDKKYSDLERMEKFAWCNMRIMRDFINISVNVCKEWKSYYAKCVESLRFRYKLMHYANFYCDINSIVCEIFKLRFWCDRECDLSDNTLSLRYTTTSNISNFEILKTGKLIGEWGDSKIYFTKSEVDISNNINWRTLSGGSILDNYFQGEYTGRIMLDVDNEGGRYDDEMVVEFENGQLTRLPEESYVFNMMGRVCGKESNLFVDWDHIDRIDLRILPRCTLLIAHGVLNTEKTILRCLEKFNQLPDP